MTNWLKEIEELNRKERTFDGVVFFVCTACAMVLMVLILTGDV